MSSVKAVQVVEPLPVLELLLQIDIAIVSQKLIELVYSDRYHPTQTPARALF